MAIPKVGHVLRGWMQKIDVSKITKVVINHRVVKSPTVDIYELNLQPMSPEKVNKKPEEQRSWKFYDIWMRSSRELNNNDEIHIGNKKYTIISKYAWEQAGFFHYEATEDFITTGATTT